MAIGISSFVYSISTVITALISRKSLLIFSIGDFVEYSHRKLLNKCHVHERIRLISWTLACSYYASSSRYPRRSL